MSAYVAHHSTPEKRSDLWATPQAFFDDLNREFHFDIDVCALHKSAKCPTYFTPEDDGLSREWDGACFCNPPFSDIEPWFAKAREELNAGRCRVAVFLVPSRTGTAWWHKYAAKSELRWIRGRLKFGDGKGSCPFDCCLVVMR